MAIVPVPTMSLGCTLTCMHLVQVCYTAASETPFLAVTGTPLMSLLNKATLLTAATCCCTASCQLQQRSMTLTRWAVKK